MAKYPGVPSSVIKRLPRYYRYLTELSESGEERISSRKLANITGLTASQIRHDLNCFASFGQQGYGYNVSALRDEIAKILRLDGRRPAILLGAGHLGTAIAGHLSFDARGFELIGIFDNDPAKTGKPLGDMNIRHTDELTRFCDENAPQVAVLCVPENAARELVAMLVERGVIGFWNFSHYDLVMAYGERIVVENVHLGDSLMTLSFNVSERAGD